MLVYYKKFFKYKDSERRRFPTVLPHCGSPHCAPTVETVGNGGDGQTRDLVWAKADS